jgi:hypothetical protein
MTTMNKIIIDSANMTQAIWLSHKDSGYGNETPNPSRIAPPPPRPKK